MAGWNTFLSCCSPCRCHHGTGVPGGKKLRVTLAGFSVGTCGCIDCQLPDWPFVECTSLSVNGTYDLDWVNLGVTNCSYQPSTYPVVPGASGSFDYGTTTCDNSSSSNIEIRHLRVRFTNDICDCYVERVALTMYDVDVSPRPFMWIFSYQQSGPTKYRLGDTIPNAACSSAVPQSPQLLGNDTGTIELVGWV